MRVIVWFLFQYILRILIVSNITKDNYNPLVAFTINIDTLRETRLLPL